MFTRLLNLIISTRLSYIQPKSHHNSSPITTFSSAAAATLIIETGTAYPRRDSSQRVAVEKWGLFAATRKTSDRYTIKVAIRLSHFTWRSTWEGSQPVCFVSQYFPWQAPFCQSFSPKILIEQNMSKWLKYRFSSCHWSKTQTSSNSYPTLRRVCEGVSRDSLCSAQKLASSLLYV